MSDDGTISGGDISAAYDAAAGASPASSTSDTTAPATGASADATSQLAGQPATDATATPQTGVPPEHRWPSILDNARNEWKQQYGWAEQVDRADLEEVIEIARLSKDDPIAYVQKVIADLQDDPTHGPRLRSLAARALSQGRGQQQAPPGQLPIIELEDGSRLDMNAVLAAQEEKLRREYAPALTAAQKLQLAEDKHAANEFASTVASELQGFDKQVHGNAMVAEIKREIAKYPKNDPRTDHPDFLEAATLRAYMKVVVPTLSTSARKAALAEAGQKVHANTVNPAPPRTGAPVALKDMSMADALRAEWARVNGT